MLYGMLTVWYGGTVWWIYYVVKDCLRYGMLLYIRSVRVEYVVLRTIKILCNELIYRPLERIVTGDHIKLQSGTYTVYTKNYINRYFLPTTFGPIFL